MGAGGCILSAMMGGDGRRAATADPFPGSTHNDTLTHLILHLKKMGAKSITIGERSGAPDTSDVLQEKGIYDLCKRLDVAKPVLDAECIVTTCCLKTHGFGGVFTMSLKLSVGITHKRNMRELHTSFFSMRKMIAEINQVYRPSLILLDGIEAFVDGGPATGKMHKDITMYKHIKGYLLKGHG